MKKKHTRRNNTNTVKKYKSHSKRTQKFHNVVILLKMHCRLLNTPKILIEYYQNINY